MSLASILGFGFLLGLRHAADPDHVVAVSTIVARSKRLGTAWLLGAVWGLGHSATILVAGGAIILFHLSVPPRLEPALEGCVGAALIVLGSLNIAGRGTGPSGLTRHSHAHDHDDPEHRHELLEASGEHARSHAHLFEPGWLTRISASAGPAQLARAALVGLVHGLAGSAAAALLVLATIREPLMALFYLVVFASGTVAGMLLLSSLMGLAMNRLAASWRTAERSLVLATGLLSVLLGASIVHESALGAGLFTNLPRGSGSP